jgi:ribonuclease P protein component
VLRNGIKIRLGWISLTACPNDQKFSRFGCAVRRRYFHKAFKRNKLKRWLKESFRQNQKQIPPGWDLVASIGNSPAKLSYQQVEKALLTLSLRLASQRKSLFTSSGGTKPSPPED